MHQGQNHFDYRAYKLAEKNGDLEKIDALYAKHLPHSVFDKRSSYVVYSGGQTLFRSTSSLGDLDRTQQLSEEMYLACWELDGWRQARILTLCYLDTLLDRGLYERADREVNRFIETLSTDSAYIRLLVFELAEWEIHHRKWAAANLRLKRAEAKITQPLTLARIEGFRGSIALALGRVEVASDHFSRERDILESIPPTDRPSLLAHNASILHRANLRLAIDQGAALDRLVEETQANEVVSTNSPALLNKLRLRQGIHRLGQERLGRQSQPSAKELLEGVLSSRHSVEIERTSARLRLAHLALIEERFDVAQSLLGDLEGILTPLDRAYRASIEAAIARQTHSSSIDTAQMKLHEVWRDLRKDWESSPGSDQLGSGTLHYERVRFLLSEIIEVALLDRQGDEAGIAALEIFLDFEELALLHRQLNANRAELSTVRRELMGPSGGIALFLPAPDRSHLVLIDRNHVSHHRLPPRDEIEIKRRELARVMSSPPSPERLGAIEQAALTLGKALFPNGAQSLIDEWSNLSVVGLDLIGPTPLAELVLKSGKSLGDEHATALLPSLSVGLALAKRADQDHSTRRKAVLISAPELDKETQERFPNAAPLPLQPKRARSVVSSYPHSEVFTGPQATLQHALRACDAETVMLQFVAHGVRDQENLGRRSLLLAPSQLASTDEVTLEGTDLAIVDGELLGTISTPPFVLLTACGSGRGARRIGDPGSTDFTGPLLESGAIAVIVSEGDLPFRDTLKNSKKLHRWITEGIPPAEALRQLRAQATARGVDPFQRSQLFAVGLAHRPLLPAKNRGVGSWTLTIVIVIVAAALLSFMRQIQRPTAPPVSHRDRKQK